MEAVTKRQRLAACMTSDGLMCALAIDQGISLTRALAAAANDAGDADARAAEFKTVLAKWLSPDASAILLDHRFGDACQAVTDAGTGILRAYETDVYGGDSETVTTLPPSESVRRLAQRGVDAIKLHMYYDPDAPSDENAVKQALIERVGAECQANDLPFLFEPLSYRPGLEAGTAAFAAVKPDIVRRSVAEFSKPGYRIDVLKIEFPVDLAFVAGTQTAEREGGSPGCSMSEALDHFRATADAAGCPFVFLSAGVTLEAFAEGLELAGQAGVPYGGYLCGRAVWRPAIEIFGRGGSSALADWAKSEGRERLRRLTAIATQAAVPLVQNAGSMAAPARHASEGQAQ